MRFRNLHEKLESLFVLDFIGKTFNLFIFWNFVFSRWNSYLEPYAVIVFYGYAAWSILISIQFPYLLISLGLARASNHDMPQSSVLNTFVRKENIFLLCAFFTNNRLFNVLVCFYGRLQYLWGIHHSATEWFALDPVFVWPPIC